MWMDGIGELRAASVGPDRADPDARPDQGALGVQERVHVVGRPMTPGIEVVVCRLLQYVRCGANPTPDPHPTLPQRS
jgi:hypothetical protein